MSVQQRDDMWKWITRGLMALSTFFLAQFYTGVKELQAQANDIKTELQIVRKDVDYLRKEVDKINNDFYKPNN